LLTNGRSFLIFTLDIKQLVVKIERMAPIVLYSWVGVKDFKHACGDVVGSPLVSVAEKVCPKRLVLLWANGQKTPAEKGEYFKSWLRNQLGKRHQFPEIDLVVMEGADGHLMDFTWVYGKVENLLGRRTESEAVTINASSGTSVMTAAWMVYTNAVGSADTQLFISSKEHGVSKLKLPPGLKIDLRRVIAFSDEDPLIERYLRGELWETSASMNALVGNSAAMNRVRYQAEAVARFRVPVLIVGAPGTGKSLLAEIIHDLGRPQPLPLPQHEFLPIDCGQLHSNTEIHQVFGWVRNAFTGADSDNAGLISQADGGTLFLDEVGNAPASVQANLLRFLQTRKYRPMGSTTERESNARVIAATNVDLDEAVRQQRFRQDLLDRLRTVLIHIPPLREREEDVVSLAHLKLSEFQRDQADAMCAIGAKEKQLTVEAEEVLRRHDWPGNVRELKNLIARLVIFSAPEKTEITRADVRRQLSIGASDQNCRVLGRKMDSAFHLDDVVLEVQWNYVRLAAEQADGNKADMARLLGFGDSRTPLNTMLKKFEHGGMPNPMDLTT